MAFYYRNQNDPLWITAKFDSICSETGKPIKKGEECLYYPRTHSVVCIESKSAEQWRSQEFADNAGLLDAGW